jgi:hypothetical protein
MGERRRITITAERFDPASWEPFGWVPLDDTDPRDGDLTYEFLWGDPHVNVIAHEYDEIEHTANGVPICEVMYRHDTHTQTLMPLDVDSVVVVAPASVDFAEPGDLDRVRAFLLRPLDRLTLRRGTWHWGPFPTAPGTVHLFNVQGKRYAEDNTRADLGERAGSVFQVVC